MEPRTAAGLLTFAGKSAWNWWKRKKPARISGCFLEGVIMVEWCAEAERIMAERFGRDSILALATVEDGAPYVRQVNAYYEDGSFYVITWGLSDKMRQIGKEPHVAVAGDWFTAQGRAVNLGWFGQEGNAKLAQRLREAFASWIDNGHNDFSNENTVILQIELASGLLLSHGTTYVYRNQKG